MKVLWRIFTNCNSDAATTKVVSAHFQSARIEASDLTVTPYHKGGFLVTASTEHLVETWPCFVVDTLSLAQKTATGWILTGDINQELDAWSNSPKTPGVSAIHIQAQLGA